MLPLLKDTEHLFNMRVLLLVHGSENWKWWPHSHSKALCRITPGKMIPEHPFSTCRPPLCMGQNPGQRACTHSHAHAHAHTLTHLPVSKVISLRNGKNGLSSVTLNEAQHLSVLHFKLQLDVRTNWIVACVTQPGTPCSLEVDFAIIVLTITEPFPARMNG